MGVGNLLMFREGRWPQGRNEQLSYRVDTEPWGGSPTSPVVTLWDVTAGVAEDNWYQIGTITDVSATNLAGAAVVSGNYVDTPVVYGLTPGHLYRLEVRWTKISTSNVFEAYGEIAGNG